MRLGRVCGLGVLWLLSGRLAFGQSVQEIGVPAADKLQLPKAKAGKASYHGRAAVRVTDAAAADTDDAGRLAILPGASFQDGTQSFSPMYSAELAMSRRMRVVHLKTWRNV